MAKNVEKSKGINILQEIYKTLKLLYFVLLSRGKFFCGLTMQKFVFVSVLSKCSFCLSAQFSLF